MAKLKAEAPGLTPEDEAFAQHLALHEQQVDAYIHAFKPNTTNRRSIACMAARKVKSKPKIAERVAELRLEAARLAKEAFGVDARWILQRLIDEVNADIADLLDDTNKIKPANTWPQVWRRGLVSGLDVETTVTEDGESVSVSKLRLSDRTRRLELLGRHVDVRAFIDRKEMVKPDAPDVPVSATDDLIAEIAGKGAGGAPPKSLPH